MFIRTKRLFLRPVFPEDWQATYAGLNDIDIVRMLASVPWPYMAEDAQSYCQNREKQGFLQFAITVPDENGTELVGQIGCSRSENGAFHEIGYWLATKQQGKGYATEALGAVLEIASMLGLGRLVAGHYVDNPASGNVLRKCGFVENGELEEVNCAGRGGELVLARRYARENPANW